jgi:Protein of unknown function (DUF4232)
MLKVTTSRAVRRSAVLTATGLGGAFIALALSACGSSTPASNAGATSPASASPTSSSSGASTGSSGSSKVQTAPRMPASQCPTSSLHVTVAKLQGGGAAGTDYVPLDFTNVSGHSCQMYGFPGVSWVSGNPGSQIGDAASRTTSFGSQTVTLAAGAQAHAWLGIADAGNFPASSCHQVTAHWLKIFPPDQYAALYTSLTSQVCSAKLGGASTPLQILPIRPGAAVSGNVP